LNEGYYPLRPQEEQESPLAELGGFAFAMLREDYQAKQEQGSEARSIIGPGAVNPKNRRRSNSNSLNAFYPWYGLIALSFAPFISQP
jgi:hypothetical protein